MAQKIKIVNNSSRELPEEVVNAILDPDETLTKINDVTAEYNLKVKEYDRFLDEMANITEETFIIGDSFGD